VFKEEDSFEFVTVLNAAAQQNRVLTPGDTCSLSAMSIGVTSTDFHLELSSL